MSDERILEHLPAGLPEAYRRAAEDAADFVIERVAAVVRERRQTDPAFNLPFGFLYGLGAIGLLWKWEQQGLLPFLSTDLPTAGEARQMLVELATTDPVGLLKFAVMLTHRVTDELWRLSCDSALGADVILGEFDEALINDKLVTLLLEILEAQQANQ
jgi:hypothetical protein